VRVLFNTPHSGNDLQLSEMVLIAKTDLQVQLAGYTLSGTTQQLQNVMGFSSAPAAWRNGTAPAGQNLYSRLVALNFPIFTAAAAIDTLDTAIGPTNAAVALANTNIGANMSDIAALNTAIPPIAWLESSEFPLDNYPDDRMMMVWEHNQDSEPLMAQLFLRVQQGAFSYIYSYQDHTVQMRYSSKNSLTTAMRTGLTSGFSTSSIVAASMPSPHRNVIRRRRPSFRRVCLVQQLP
jgi:hypothetical protein